MAWFPSIRRPWTRPERKDATGLTTEWALDTPGAAGWPYRSRRRSWPFNRAVAEAYERTVWCWRAVETISGKGADRTFRYRVRGSDLPVKDHPLYRVLNGRTANPLETGKAFRKRLFAQLLLSERGVFVETTLSRAGDIVRVDLLPPGRTRPVPGLDGNLLDHFEVTLTKGGTRRVDADSVRWIRNPHPFDPYMSSIPLTAAGLSVEMDDLGRLINVSWMGNDGNTRAVIAVQGDMSDGDMSKLEQRFGAGPIDAGKVTVITADGLAFTDLSARPRDMQYKELAKNAKVETLAAFGTPESQLGNSSERTYANAEAEGFVFWQNTMLPLLDLVAAAFFDEHDDGLEPFFDTSDVRELELPARQRRAEARDEVAAGLRSIKSYGDMAGIEVADAPETNALWLPTGRTPLHQRAAASPGPAAGHGEPAADKPVADEAVGGESGGQAPDAAAPARAPDAGPVSTPAADNGAAGQAAVRKRRPFTPPTQGRQPVLVTKAAATVRTAGRDERHRTRVEDATAAALTSLTVRWRERAAARLNSPKTRKGTRHWEPDPRMPVDARAGTKELDISSVIDPTAWRAEAEAAVTPILTSAAAEATATTATELTGTAEQNGTGTAAFAAAACIAAVGTAAFAAAARIADALTAVDRSGAALADVGAALDGIDLTAWARRVGASAGAAAVEAGRYSSAAALAAGGWTVTGTWRTTQDGTARSTHQGAHGQERPAGQPFTVGTATLSYPGDPAGPPGEVINCRCHTVWSAHLR